MYDDLQQSGRVGQTGYWVRYGVTVVLTAAVFGVGAYKILLGDALAGLLLLLLSLPVTIYFRVIMVRRCRDINWPAFLPWVLFGCCFLSGLLFGPRLGMTSQAVAAAIFILMIMSLIDFAFTIVIGCISTAVSSFNYETEYEKYAREYGVDVTPAADDARREPALSAFAPSIASSQPRPGFGRKQA